MPYRWLTIASARCVDVGDAADRSVGLGRRQVTLTNGELEPEFVSYATLRRHTFCFKGMKQCEFDHDPTDSRAPPADPRTSHCDPFSVRLLVGAFGSSFAHGSCSRSCSLSKLPSCAHSIAFCYGPLGSLRAHL